MLKMPKKRLIQVEKVSLTGSQTPIDYPRAFPRMPRLYLELLENKAKIKQDLINKPYVPDEVTESPRNDTNGKYAHRSRSLSSSDSDDHRSHDDGGLSERLRLLVESDTKSEASVEREKPTEEEDEWAAPKTPTSVDPWAVDEDGTQIDVKSEDNQTDHSDRGRSVDGRESRDRDHTKEPQDDDRSSVAGDEVAARLKELLNADDSDNESIGRFRNHSDDRSRAGKYSRHRDHGEHSIDRGGDRGGDRRRNIAPSIEELKAQGGYVPREHLRDINNIPANEQEDEDMKRELMFKFELLKKSYPTANIPEFSIHSERNTMQKSYDTTVRRLSLDSTVENYKRYLIGGFMACEFVFGNFLGFDMQGFTQQQIVSMNSYEKLLIELGEKSYVPSGSKWPIELRLLFLVIMNAAFFVVSKMIMKKTGANLMGMINSMNTPPTGGGAPTVRKRRMQGPNIDLDDIPDVP